MEKTNNNIRILILFEVIYPIFCTTYHILESKSLPDIFLQPVRYSRCNHTQYSNLHTITFYDLVWWKIRLISFIIDNISTKHWTFHFLNPFVVYSMSSFNIMVSHGFSIILHVVDNFCCNIGTCCVYIIVIVASRLTLQNITIV